MAAQQQILELQDVKRSFGTKAILKGINLSVGFGELVALYGPSGSGKSTLLNLVGAIDRPSGGTIRMVGRDVGRMWEMQRTKLRRSQIGFIFQNYPLIASYSASENIDMSLRLKGVSLWERRRRIKAALEAVGLSDHARRLPDQLSGGQQQRVAIARVLALHPTIILADEPTSGLDTRTARRVMKIFQGLAEAEGTAFLVVSHDIDLTERFVNRAYDLRDGLLVLRPPVGSVPEEVKSKGLHTVAASYRDETDPWDTDDEPEFMTDIPRAVLPGIIEPEFLADITFDAPVVVETDSAEHSLAEALDVVDEQTPIAEAEASDIVPQEERAEEQEPLSADAASVLPAEMAQIENDVPSLEESPVDESQQDESVTADKSQPDETPNDVIEDVVKPNDVTDEPPSPPADDTSS